jgi:hypothetical protein
MTEAVIELIGEFPSYAFHGIPLDFSRQFGGKGCFVQGWPIYALERHLLQLELKRC